MTISEEILKIDALLDQLDALAESEVGLDAFWARWFDALQAVTPLTAGESVLHWVGPSELTSRADAGAIGGELSVFQVGTQHPEFWSSLIPVAQFESLTWSVRLAGCDEQHPVVAGFLQVASKYLRGVAINQTATGSAISRWQVSLVGVHDRQAFMKLLCEDGARLFTAERVTLVRTANSKAKMLSMTGFASTTLKSDASRERELTALRFHESAEVLGCERVTEDHYLIQFALASDYPHRSIGVVQFEWSSGREFAASFGKVLSLLPFVQAAGIRMLAGEHAVKSRRRLRHSLLGLSAVCLLGITGWLTKDIETTLRVDATGVTQPLNQRILYSTCDGYVQQLLVEQDQVVSEGDLIMRLRSPSTELQLQNIEGEIAAAIQERAGLQVALNEVRSQRTDSTAATFQLAAEIAGLEARIGGLEKQRDILRAEAGQFTITSPISGVVTSHDVQQALEGKPVSRGEPLLRICDTTGEWQLRLEVDQRDIVTVLSAKLPRCSFRLLNDPARVFEGTIHSIDSHVELSQVAEAMGTPRQIVPVIVSFDHQQVSNLQMDASVIAKIECGSDKWWKNMTRELLNSLRRRFWINA